MTDLIYLGLFVWLWWHGYQHGRATERDTER